MSDQPSPARSFGDVAAAYDRARPSYPREAAAWLVGEQPVTVLELGAGTGKLTEVLVELGHDVHATDPDERMLGVLRDRLPDVRTSLAAAEDIPAPDASYDVVVAAQALHWFHHERAFPEIARVLKPRGRLAVAWNVRDERIPWVRRFGRLIGTNTEMRCDQEIVTSPYFGFVEDRTFRFWHVVDRESIQELVLSRSSVASLDEAGRRRKLAEVVEFYDDYGRGMDGMQLPYECQCFRAHVVRRPEREPSAAGPDPDAAGDTGGDGAGSTPDAGPVTDDGSDADVLLIDFR